MSKAEERAKERYQLEPTNIDTREKYCAYVEGYNQAKKDLELTWEDVALFETISKEFIKNNTTPMTDKDYYQEVLKQFNEKRKPIYSPDKTSESCIDTSPKNKTPLVYSHFDYTKRVELREKLETIFNVLGIDNIMGIRDFVLAEMVDNFLCVTYNTKRAMEELGYNNVIDNENK